MRRKGKRLVLIGAALGVAGVAAGLTLFALRDSVVFFYGPTEFAEKAPALGTRLRIGGLVEKGSLQHVGDDAVSFVVTDMTHDVKVSFTGLLPDLFREGQGVVAEGIVAGPDSFKADSVLAKHDETYMPREVADALKKSGRWREGEPVPTDRTANK
jgi:cytochrome c-type biogenesis protein CcmE